jgi:hypothetical protein
MRADGPVIDPFDDPDDDPSYKDRYRRLCPGGDLEEFHLAVMTFFILGGPFRVPQGYSKTINNGLKSIRNTIKALNIDARNEIIRREAQEIAVGLEASGHDASQAYQHENVSAVTFAGQDILNRLGTLVEQKYTGRKQDFRRKDLALMASSLWKSHGGTISLTDGRTGFIKFLQQIIDDIDFKDGDKPYDPFRMIRDFDLHKNSD